MTTTTLARSSAGHAQCRGRRAAVISVAAAAASIVVIALAGVLDPGYSALSEGISALGSTESQSAPLMAAGFALMALTAISAAFGDPTRREIYLFVRDEGEVRHPICSR